MRSSSSARTMTCSEPLPLWAFSLSGGSSSNYGLIFVPLKSVDTRTKEGPGHTANAIFQDLAPKLFGVPGGHGGYL